MKIYLVGGAVRDELLNIKNDDMDYVVVGATPADMRELGYENVGESFPVYLDQTTGDQYALARREKKTGAGYTGFTVDFDPSVTLEEDLWRRDLTINALAKDIETGDIADPHGGLADLENKILRHVSDAFIEDPLRVVRLARFYARFSDFNLAIETVKLAQFVVSSGEMEMISSERYWAEMQKMFYQSEHPERFFSALHLFGVMNNVSFFKNLFGPMNEFYLDNLIAPVAKAAVKFADPVEIFTIAAAQRAAVFDKAPSRIAKGHQMLKKIRELAYDEVVASDMVKLLKMMNAVSRDSELLQDMILVLRLIESTNWAFEWKFRLKSEGLRLAADLAQSVTAQPYTHLEGPAIGRAMDAERTLKIAGIL